MYIEYGNKGKKEKRVKILNEMWKKMLSLPDF